jgi:hypothetical protein
MHKLWLVPNDVSQTMDLADWADVLGAAEAAQLLGIHRSGLTRGVLAGLVKPLAKLPGRTGAYVFSRRSIEALQAQLAAPPAATPNAAEPSPPVDVRTARDVQEGAAASATQGAHMTTTPESAA